MSSISSVSSTTTNPYQASAQSSAAQVLQDFGALGSALQSGDLSGAQSALKTFQTALQGGSSSATTQPFGSNAQANTAFQSLVNDLKSGNLSSAQQDYTNLQKSLQGTGKTHHSHHHHSATDTDSDSDSASTDSTGSTDSSSTETVSSLLDMLA